MLVGFICATVWFTVVKPEADPGEYPSSSGLTINGELSGFVYIRSLRAFADYSLADKLLGKGLGRALAALTPYFDDPDAIAQAGGVFTDAHCQILQFLLTCGLFGASAFLAFMCPCCIPAPRPWGMIRFSAAALRRLQGIRSS